MTRSVGVSLLLTVGGLLALLLFLAPQISADVTCGAGGRPIRPDDIANAAKMGITLPTGITCVDANVARWLDSTALQDIEYLKSKTCSGNYGLPSGFNADDTSPGNWNAVRNSRTGYVYFFVNGAAMNPGALKCFRQLFEKASTAPHNLQPCISAALRSPAHQRSSCMDSGNSTVCGRSGRGTGPASSCPTNLASYNVCAHVNGLAIDVGEKTGKLEQLLSLARSMNFSKVGAGAADPWHIEAANCSDGNFRPTTNTTDTWSGVGTPLPQNTSPTTALSNALRTMLTPTPPPIIPPQPVQPYYDPTQYFTPPTYPTSSPNPPPTPPPPPSPILPPPSPTPPPPPPTSATTSTSTVTLINGINNPVGIDVGTKPKIIGTSTVVVSSSPQTTFKSEDLNKSPMQLGLFKDKNPLFILLESLKQVLIKMLTVIRPFGRMTPQTSLQR